MSVRAQFRQDTAANWTSVNPVLLKGEPGYEWDTGKFKIGDGTTVWASLAYSSGLTGATGAAGAAGAAAYVYIAYASDDAGTGFTTTFDAALNYVAIKKTTSPLSPPVVGDFAGLWKNYKGAAGATGAAGALPIATAGGTADAITADYTPDLTLADLTLCVIVAAYANATATPTFAPDGLTAHTIVKKGGQALAAGDISGAGAVCILEYNSANTRWELLNPVDIHALATGFTLSGGTTPKTLTVSGDSTIGGTASRIVGQKSTGDTGMLTGAEARAILATAPFVLGSDADGDMYYRASSALARLAKGTGLQQLRMNTGATAPEWATIAAGGIATDAIWDAAGDLVYGTGADTASRLAAGAANLKMFMNAGATAPEWAGGMALTSHTYDLTTASGNQTLTGAGFTPSKAIVVYGLASKCGGVGFSDGSTNGEVRISYNNTLVTSPAATFMFPQTGASDYQSCVLTFNSDGGVLAWTKTDSPTGTITFKVLWLR